MAYQKQTWRNLPDRTTPITAERLEHMETQYDEAVADSYSYTNSSVVGLASEEYVDSAVDGALGDEDSKGLRVSHTNKVYSATGSTYTVIRIHTGGRFVPGLVGKSFGLGVRPSTSGPDLKPPRESPREASKRLGSPVVFNASGWKTTGNVGELRGAQIWDGVVYHEPTVNHWKESDTIGYTKRGELKCYSLYTSGDTTDDMLEDEVIHTWTFGPNLVVNGQKKDLTGGFWGTFLQGTSGRQVLGQTQDGDILLLTCRGVTGGNSLTGSQLQDLCLDEGFYNAYNLDGGGSTQTQVNGAAYTASSDSGGNRDVPDFGYFTVPVATPVIADEIPLPLGSGMVNNNASHPSYIQDYGNYALLNADIKPASGTFNNTSAGVTLGTLPQYLRPNRTIIDLAVGNGTRVRKAVVYAAGDVNLVQYSSTDLGDTMDYAILANVRWDLHG